MINKDKNKESLLHDLNAIFDCVVYEFTGTIINGSDCIEIHLAKNVNITACDFPHLLTIARNYNATISIFVVKSNQLGIFLRYDCDKQGQTKK